MNQRSFWVLLLMLLLCAGTGCGEKGDTGHGSTEAIAAAGSTSTEETVQHEQLAHSTAEKTPLSYEDTYWAAVEHVTYICDCEEHQESPRLALPAPRTEDRASWWMDMFFFADGSMLLRDVSNDCYTGMSVEGTWEADEAGQVTILSGRNLETGMEIGENWLPSLYFVDGSDPDEENLKGALALEYFGGVVYFQQKPMPGQDLRLCMADLQGDWTMVSLEIEGYVSDGSNEGVLAALSFEESAYGVEAVYTKHSSYTGVDEQIRASVIRREDPLYSGCGNETWSVELRPQEYGQEEIVQFRAALLERDTLLLQRRYLIDGGPAFCYETYRRGNEAFNAIELQRKLEKIRTQAPESTLLCVGVDQYNRQDPGLDRVMTVAALAEGEASHSLVLMCPEYAWLQVIWKDEVIHETQVGYGEVEMLLLEIPENPGICRLVLSPDEQNWYVWDVSQENIVEPGWLNILGPE